MAKVSKAKQWEMDHPDDRPCPKTPTAAKAWRINRGISKLGDYRLLQVWKRYDAAMAEKEIAIAEKLAKVSQS